jgi:hypothetical protein
MAHELEFSYNPKNGADPCSLDSIVEEYIEFRNAPVRGTNLVYRQMDVSEMLAMTRRPEDFIETLGSWAATWGSDSQRYDIGKFGWWYCSECGADDIELGSYDDECDEE